MKKVIWAGLVVIGMAACQSKPGGQDAASSTEAPAVAQGEIDSLKKAVLDAHDRVMPEMNPMGRLRNRLKEAAGRHPADSSQYRKARAQLAEAQDQMKNWMRQFKLPADSSAAYQKDYLEDQHQMMQDIEKLTNRAIQQARQLLPQRDSSRAVE